MFARYRPLAAALAAALVLAACSAGVVSEEVSEEDAEIMAEFGLTADELKAYKKAAEECDASAGIPGTRCEPLESFMANPCVGAAFCVRLRFDANGDVGVFTVEDQSGPGLRDDEAGQAPSDGESDQGGERTCSTDPALCREFTLPREVIDDVLSSMGSSSGDDGGSSTAETTEGSAPSSAPSSSETESEPEASSADTEPSDGARPGDDSVVEPPVVPSARVDAGVG